MQLIFTFDDRPAMLAEIHRRLLAEFNRPGPFLRLDPVSQLVMGMLGWRTHDEDSTAAFKALLARFGHWEAVRDAPVAEIQTLIAGVTFAERKAPCLKEALETITMKQGRLTLDFLDGLTVNAALIWLERLPGVGRKSAAATLNFSTLRKRALVIDTHHLRALRRLALVDQRCDLARAYERLMPLLPESWTAEEVDVHHQLMKTLGQATCRHAVPHCCRCPLRDLCPARECRQSASAPAQA